MMLREDGFCNRALTYGRSWAVATPPLSAPRPSIGQNRLAAAKLDTPTASGISFARTFEDAALKIGVIADAHGNCGALEAVMDADQRCSA